MAKQNSAAALDETRATVSIPEAGKILGVGRNASYDAANRGEIPVIMIGKLKRVPVVRLKRMLEGDAA